MRKKGARPLTEGLAAVENAARTYAGYRTELAERVASINAQMQAVIRSHMRFLRGAIARAQDARADLLAALEANAAEFEKPRTRSFHGVKVGFRKGVGGISWDDPDQVVKLIKKHFPEQQEILVKTTEVPVKKALEQLTTADLKRIGCTVEETGDVPVISADESAVDKLVKALLKDQQPDEGGDGVKT